MQIVLASSSPYRASLLRRLLETFAIDAPDVDETALPGEIGTQLARRLAAEKAHKVAGRHPQSLIIGSDQVAILRQIDGTSLNIGKPGDFDTAAAQLAQCSGREVDFLVACHLVNTQNGSQTAFEDSYTVRYKTLSADTIARYLHRDQPYDCAGSIRTEGLGVALIEAQRGSDPTTLIGLPLIALASALEKHGVCII